MNFKKLNVIVIIFSMIITSLVGSVSYARDVDTSTSSTSTEVWLDGTHGKDSNDGSQGSPVQSFAKAKALVPEGGIIKVISFEENQGIELDKNATLELTQDITLTGGSKGIILKNGGVLTAPGHTLTMTGYTDIAIEVTNGGILRDGNYHLSGQHGLVVKGTGLVEGSTGRNQLQVTSTDKKSDNFIQTGGSKKTFKNATVEIISKSTEKIGSGRGGLFGAWVDGGHGFLNLDNVDMTIKGIGGGFYVTPNIQNSNLTVDKDSKDIKIGMTINASGEINNSTVSINTGWQDAVSIAGGTKELNIINSTINLNNKGTGGFNVANGRVIINNSKVNGDGPEVLFGTGLRDSHGIIDLDKETIVNTNKFFGGRKPKNHKGFFIEGGNYLFNLSGSFNNDGTPKINKYDTNPLPINKFEDILSLFLLTDSNKQVITVPNKDSSESYEYEIPEGNENKNVWLPDVNISFNPKGGVFSDGDTNTKNLHGARGLAFNEIKSWNGVPIPNLSAPSQIGKKFEGWFLKEGSTEAFDLATPLTKDIELEAHWSEDTKSYGIVYNNNNITGEKDNSVSIQVAGNNDSRTEVALSYQEIIAKNKGFRRIGYLFTGWNTKKDGSGQAINPSEMVNIPKDTNVIILYAQYKPDFVTVKFHANGGTFKDGTIFNNEKFFTLEDDGQTAVLKGEILAGTKLMDALKALDPSVIKYGYDENYNYAEMLPPALNSQSQDLKNLIDPPKFKEMIISKTVLSWIFGDSIYYAWYPENNITPADAASKALTIDRNTVIDSNKDYYLAWKTKSDVEKINLESSIESTLYVNDNISSIPPTTVLSKENFNVTSTLNMNDVKNQLHAFEEQYFKGNPTPMTLSDLQTDFIGTLTLPEGIKEPENLTKDQIATEGFKDFFEVYDVVVKGQQVIVKMRVKNPQDINTYEKLKEGLMNIGVANGEKSELKITVPSIEAENISPNTNYPIKGDFKADFHAFATKDDTKKTLEFNLKWKSTPETSINSVKEIVSAENMPVYGDILVGDNTEHDALYPVKSGADLEYTGRLYMQDVKNKIDFLKQSYTTESNRDTSHIILKNTNAQFEVTLSLGEGLTVKYPSVIIVNLEENPLFEVKKENIRYDDTKKQIKILMTIKQKYKKFDDLYKDVLATGGEKNYVDIKLKGISVYAFSGQQTLIGEVKGLFNSLAITNNGSGSSRYYDFTWKAEQILENPNGQDFILKNDKNNKTIQFTSEVKENNKPVVKPIPNIKPEKHHKKTSVKVIQQVKEKLNVLDHYAYMFGYPDKTFRPEREMTRAEVAAMFARLMVYQPAENKEYNTSYNDVKKEDWYFRAVEFMKENGIVTGYPDGSFRPNGHITRAEFATMASRFDKLAENKGVKFSDVLESYWASKYINSAVEKGWINGYPDGTFKPERDITRAEVVTVTNHMLNREADKEFVDKNEKDLIEFKDLKDKNYWAYYDIREATDGHEYHRKGNGIEETWEMLNHKAFRFAVVGRYE